MAERGYSRLDRVGVALREVIADELERVDDERLELVTITGVKVAPDLRQALVYYDSLRGLDEVAEALTLQRVSLQSAVNRQLRLKWTPELSFAPDPAIAAGSRVEQILRQLRDHPAPEPGEAPAEDDSP